MSEWANVKTVFVYDGSFEGLLSAVHMAYYSRRHPDEILCVNGLQREFMTDYITVKTDMAKSRAVYNSIPKKISADALYKVYCVFLSEESDKATLIYKYLRLGYKLGREIDMHMSEDTVIRMWKVSGYVSKEAHNLKGFVRFTQMDNGVLFSKISPVNNILEMLCRYFADRLPSEPWVICDVKRSIAGIYDTKKYVIYEVDTALLGKMEEHDEYYERLWKKFYDTVAIKSRENPKQRRSMMPKMYWKHMTEFRNIQ